MFWFPAVFRQSDPPGYTTDENCPFILRPLIHVALNAACEDFCFHVTCVSALLWQRVCYLVHLSHKCQSAVCTHFTFYAPSNKLLFTMNILIEPFFQKVTVFLCFETVWLIYNHLNA